MFRRAFQTQKHNSQDLNSREAGGTYTFMVLVTCTSLIALGNTLFGATQQTLNVNYLRQHRVAGQQLIRAGVTVLENQKLFATGLKTIKLESGQVEIDVKVQEQKVTAKITAIPTESKFVTGPQTAAKVEGQIVNGRLAIASIQFTRQVNVPNKKLEGQ